MLDSVRDTGNPVNEEIGANYVGGPGGYVSVGANSSVDFLSNGFKMRNAWTPLNYAGETYIYAAFAEAPFKYATAR